MGVKPPEGDLWEQSTVSHIVKNEVYLGQIIWGKEKHMKRNGKRVRKKVPPELWIRHESAHEDILSQEEFDEANTALRDRWRTPKREGVSLSNPLAVELAWEVSSTTLFFGAQPGNEPFFEKLGYKRSLQSFVKRKARPQSVPNGD